MILRLSTAALLLFVVMGSCAAAELTFEGNEMFNRNQLLSALRRFQIAQTGAFEVTDADDAAFFLREFYFKQGYRDADVTYLYNPQPQGALFTISEGPRIFIGEVTFEDGNAIAIDRLREIFNAAIRQATSSPFGRLRYLESAVEAATEQIRSAFVNDGYLDVEVDRQEAPGLKGVVNINFPIRQGRQYHISGIQIEGLDAKERVSLELTLNSFLKRIYRPGEEVLGQSRALDHLRNAGFYEAKTSASAEINHTTTDVLLRIKATSGPLYTLGQIVVAGNKRTNTAAILGRFGLKSGRPYNSAAINEGERRLWFSGAFSDVKQSVQIQPGHRLDLLLDVTEGSSKQISATVGYGEWDQAFGTLSYTDRNFLGTLNRLNITGSISQKSYGTGATFSAPYLFNTDLTGYVGGFYLRRELPAYKATQLGGLVGIEQKLLESSQTGYSLAFEWKAVTDSEIFSEPEQNVLVDYNVGSIIWTQRLDRRNDPLIPMQGYFLSYEAAIASEALMGDLSFFRAEAQATYYLPLRKITPEKPFVPFMIFNSRSGVIIPYGNTGEVPVQERFFLGGPDTVRSFQLDGLGPRGSDAVPLGGQAYFQGNVELQWPVWRSLYVANFVDVGNLAPEIQDFDWDQTRVALGLGLRLYTPLGAIRMDYGYNLIRIDGDPIGAWQFGFGLTF